MDNSEEKKELLNELAIISTLVDENPCRMSTGILKALAVGVRTLIGSHLGNGASREQVARYLKRDVRTLSDWSKKYDDFPTPGRTGKNTIEYDWIEIVNWKLNHKELYG